MRIAHLADTHLGYRHLARTDESGRNIRELDVYRVFDEAIDRIVELKLDAVIHAGDLFDSHHPTNRALGVALDGLKRLRNAGIPVVVIAGNHSTPRYAHVGHVFGILERFGGVHAIWREPETVNIGDLAVLAIPHHPDPNQLDQTVRSARPVVGKANVLTFHAGLDGLSRLGAGEAASLTIDGGVLEAGAEFDYIALGHLHARQGVRVNACYAGSLERLTFADHEARKGFVEVDLSLSLDAPDRVRFHDVTPRSMATIGPIDCARGDDVTELILEAASHVVLHDSVIRCPLVGLSQDQFRSLDMRRLRTHFASCLHFELRPEFTHTPALVDAPPDLRSFLAARGAENGLEIEELFRRAQQLLSEADATIGP